MKVEPKMMPRNNGKNNNNGKPKMSNTTGKGAGWKPFEKNAEATLPYERRKIEQIKYVKRFDNVFDGFSSMMNCSKDINDLTAAVNDRVPETVDEAMDMMLSIFTGHMPSYDTKKNMHYDVNLSANKCSLKTDRYISFGWFVKNDWEQNTTEFIFHVTVFGDKKELIEQLLNNGWEVDTYKK